MNVMDIYTKCIDTNKQRKCLAIVAENAHPETSVREQLQ